MSVITSPQFHECLRQEIAKLSTTYTSALSGAVFVGNLVSGNREGYGKFTWPNGNTYEGEYVDNKRQGQGVEIWSSLNGEFYEGSFVNDRRHGVGEYHWASGDEYSGCFFNDQRHGRGIYSWADGSYFDGYFYMNCKEGYGRHKDATNEALFEGLYHMDKRLGPGRLIYQTSQKDADSPEAENDNTWPDGCDVGFWHGERLYRLLVDMEQINIPPEELGEQNLPAPAPPPQMKEDGAAETSSQAPGPTSPYFNFNKQYPEYEEELVANSSEDADLWMPVTGARSSPQASHKSPTSLGWLSPFLTNPPDPVDYDPKATAIMRSRLSSTLQRVECDAKSSAFNENLANDEFEKELQSKRHSRVSSAARDPVRGSPLLHHQDDHVAVSSAEDSSEKETLAPSRSTVANVISNDISWRRWNRSPISTLLQNHTLRYVPHTPEHLKLWICDPEKVQGPGLPKAPKKRSKKNKQKNNSEVEEEQDVSLFTQLRSLHNRSWEQLGPLEKASCLFIAHAARGNKKAVKELLESGKVDVNVSDTAGRTALLEAATHWHTDLIEMLLDAGANVNQLADVGMTPLSACVTRYYPRKYFLPNWSEECITLMGQRRMPGQPKARNPFADLPPDVQVDWFNVDDEPGVDNRGDSALGDSRASSAASSVPSSTAAVDDKAAYRKRMLKKKVQQQQKKAEERAAKATMEMSFVPNESAAAPATSEDTKVPEANISAPTAPDKAGDEPQDSRPTSAQRSDASSRSSTQQVDHDKLLDDLNEELALNDEQLLALPEDSHKVLVDYQLQVPQQFLDVFATELSANQHFLERGGVAGKEGKHRKKAQLMAEQRKMNEIIRLLLRRGADPNLSRVPMPIIFFIVKTADVEILRLFLQKGMSVNVRLPENRGGLTPLHLAVGLPNKSAVRVVELLLNALADPDARAAEDGSFLDATLNEEWSKDSISLEQARLLGGKTPLQIACSRDDSYKMCAEMVRLLLQHHGNPQLMCNGHTPLTLAIASGNDQAIEILLQYGADPSLALSHGVSSALCVASNIAFEHRRSPDQRLALIDRLIKAGADVLAPVPIGLKRQLGTFVDYAHQSFALDKKVAHTPYHALNAVEREVFNARKRLLAHVGNWLREKAVDREKSKLDAQSKAPFDSTGRDVSPSNEGGSRKPSANKAARRSATGAAGASESRVSFHDNVELLQQSIADALDRKATFRYCYECGRSVGVRLTACTRCKEVFFCSKVCKVKAWNARHKDECIRIGGRNSPSGKGDKSRIDSPTMVTDPDFIGRRQITVPSLLRDAQMNKLKSTKIKRRSMIVRIRSEKEHLQYQLKVCSAMRNLLMSENNQLHIELTLLKRFGSKQRPQSCAVSTKMERIYAKRLETLRSQLNCTQAEFAVYKRTHTLSKKLATRAIIRNSRASQTFNKVLLVDRPSAIQVDEFKGLQEPEHPPHIDNHELKLLFHRFWGGAQKSSDPPFRYLLCSQEVGSGTYCNFAVPTKHLVTKDTNHATDQASQSNSKEVTTDVSQPVLVNVDMEQNQAATEQISPASLVVPSSPDTEKMAVQFPNLHEDLEGLKRMFHSMRERCATLGEGEYPLQEWYYDPNDEFVQKYLGDLTAIQEEHQNSMNMEQVATSQDGPEPPLNSLAGCYELVSNGESNDFQCSSPSNTLSSADTNDIIVVDSEDERPNQSQPAPAAVVRPNIPACDRQLVISLLDLVKVSKQKQLSPAHVFNLTLDRLTKYIDENRYAEMASSQTLIESMYPPPGTNIAEMDFADRNFLHAFFSSGAGQVDQVDLLKSNDDPLFTVPLTAWPEMSRRMKETGGKWPCLVPGVDEEVTDPFNMKEASTSSTFDALNAPTPTLDLSSIGINQSLQMLLPFLHTFPLDSSSLLAQAGVAAGADLGLNSLSLSWPLTQDLLGLTLDAPLEQTSLLPTTEPAATMPQFAAQDLPASSEEMAAVSLPVVDPVTVEKPILAEKTFQAEKVVPAEETNSVKEAIPAEELIFVEEVIPAKEAPAVEQAVAAQVIPVEEAIAAQEVILIREAIAAQEVIAAKEATAAQEVFPVEETIAAQEAIAAKEATAAQEVFPVEETIAAQEAIAAQAMIPSETVAVEEAVSMDEAVPPTLERAISIEFGSPECILPPFIVEERPESPTSPVSDGPSVLTPNPEIIASTPPLFLAREETDISLQPGEVGKSSKKNIQLPAPSVKTTVNVSTCEPSSTANQRIVIDLISPPSSPREDSIPELFALEPGPYDSNMHHFPSTSLLPLSRDEEEEEEPMPSLSPMVATKSHRVRKLRSPSPEPPRKEPAKRGRKRKHPLVYIAPAVTMGAVPSAAPSGASVVSSLFATPLNTSSENTPLELLKKKARTAVVRVRNLYPDQYLWDGVKFVRKHEKAVALL